MPYDAWMSARSATRVPSAAGALQGIVRPHIGWWVAVLFGMTLLGVLAWSEFAYGVWARHITGGLPRWLLMLIFLVAVGLHLGEAIYAQRLARRSGTGTYAIQWFWQTLLLGYPSLRLLRMQDQGNHQRAN